MEEYHPEKKTAYQIFVGNIVAGGSAGSSCSCADQESARFDSGGMNDLALCLPTFSYDFLYITLIVSVSFR